MSKQLCFTVIITLFCACEWKRACATVNSWMAGALCFIAVCVMQLQKISNHSANGTHFIYFTKHKPSAISIMILCRVCTLETMIPDAYSPRTDVRRYSVFSWFPAVVGLGYVLRNLMRLWLTSYPISESSHLCWGYAISFALHFCFPGNIVVPTMVSVQVLRI